MITGILTSILGGGITGIAGTAIQRFADHKAKKLDGELEIKKREIDLQIMKEEWNQRVKVAEVEGAARVEEADAQAFAASFQEPTPYSAGTKKTHAQVWVLLLLDLLRGSIRPLLTIYVCLLVTAIYLQAASLLNHETLSPLAALGLVEQIIQTVLYLCTSVVCWWFGTRAPSGKGPK